MLKWCWNTQLNKKLREDKGYLIHSLTIAPDNVLYYSMFSVVWDIFASQDMADNLLTSQDPSVIAMCLNQAIFSFPLHFLVTEAAPG